MSYALRNTLIIGVLLALVLIGGAYWIYFRLPGELAVLKEKEKERKTYLDRLNGVYDDYEIARTKLDSLEKEWRSRTKVVPPDTSPASLFAYLNRLLRLRPEGLKPEGSDRSDLTFDFAFQRRVSEKDYGYIVCALTGRGSFQDLYNLVWRLENERRLVKIESLKMREEQVMEEEGGKARSMLAFEITLHAYYTSKDVGAERAPITYEMSTSYAGYNPFLPLVTKVLPQKPEGLIDVREEAAPVLLAMTSDRVYIRDKSGRETALKEGDRVYLGRLTRIYPERGQALFTLNEGGFVRRVMLSMEFSGEAEEEVEPGDKPKAEAPEGWNMSSYSTPQVRFLGVEVKDVPDGIQVLITNSGYVPYTHFELESPHRIVLDMEPAVYGWERNTIEVDRGPIRQVRSSQFKRFPSVVRVVVELTADVPYEITRENGHIIVVKIPKT